MFRRRPQGTRERLDDVRAVVLREEPVCGDERAEQLRLLRRIAAEAVILQDDAEQLLREIRAREPLTVLAPRGGRLASRFVALGRSLPASRDPQICAYASRLHEVLDHHALMLSTSLDLLAVAFRSERLEEEVDRINGLGRPARWLDDLRLELLVES